jgi:outer membrane protein
MQTLQRMTIVTLALMSASVNAADLMSAWQSAQTRDPELAAARTMLEQAEFRKDQARALWAPQAVATAQAGVGGQDSRIRGADAMGQSDVSFNTNTNVGVLARASVGAQKAWINPEKQAQEQQLALSAQVAQAQWQQAEQGLMLRTAQKYFDVLSAELTLDVLLRQQKTIQQAAQEIRKRQGVGDASVMDVQEATARESDIRAQVLTQENLLEMKRVAYRQMVGQAPEKLATLSPIVTFTQADLGEANQWVQRAKEQAPALQLMRLQQGIQAQEAKRVKAGDAMSVDWVAQAQLDRLMGQGKFGSSSNQMVNYMVGMQLQAPLSTGGMVHAREQDALKQVEKLRFDEEVVQLQIEQTVRDAWQHLATAPARLAALEQSLKASQSRVTATRNAHRLGARTTNEWLGAEHDAMQAELALLQLRIQTAMERLRLQAASGVLSATGLQTVNAWLKNPS